MKKLIFVITMIAFATPALANAKFGWIDMQRALTSVKEGKRILGNLEKEVSRNKKELEKEQATLQKLKADFDNQSLVMNDKTKRDKQLEIQQRYMKFQEKYMKYQQQLQAKQGQSSQEIVAKINKVVQEFAQKSGYTYIYEKNALIYKPAGDEITEKIISLYDKKFK
jgi:outer membrane protein